MVWNRIALVSLLLVVPSAGQCDEGTCHSLQPYFNCQVHFGSGAAGAGNTISFATCPVVGDIVIRVRLVGGAHSEKYVHALEVLQPYIDLDTVRLPGHFDRLHAEDRFVEAAFLSGLVSALRSRPIRPIHRKEDGHAEMLWREKIRWSMAWVFEIAGPAASCTYCFNDTEVMMHLPLCVRQPGDGVGQCRAVRRVPLPFELQVDVMPRARPLTAEIQEMTILELLVLLTGYIMDLQKMAALGFLHDNHLGNLLLVTSTDGERKMAWHDFGARSYFSSPTPLEIESFSRLLDESYTVVIASLERHSSTRGLVAKLNQTKSKWSLEGLDGVSSHLATLAERFQEVIMEWTEGSITMRRSLLQTWGRSIPPTRLEALRQLLEQGPTSTSSVVWVRELARNKDKQLTEFEPKGNVFQVKGALSNVDDLKEAIKQKKPNRVMCDADEMNIYSQKEDGRWVKEETMSASLRSTSEADCYGFVLPPVDDA